MKSSWGAFAIGLALAFLFSGCATSTKPLPTANAAIVEAEKSDFLTAFSLINKLDRPLAGLALMAKLVESKQLDSSTFAQFYAITGDERGVYELTEKDTDSNPTPAKDMTAFMQRDAIDVIVSMARDRRLVILNESHHNPRHRAFALALAIRLREVGFTHFGAETFASNFAETMKDGAPKLKTGTYTLEPVFGDLVRQIAKSGYQLFDYEQRENQQPKGRVDRSAGISAREQAQAENIKKVFDATQGARLFIYVGGSHGSEIPDEDNLEWMALRLKRMTQLDPLTINQWVGTPQSRIEFDGPTYRGVVNLGAFNSPIVLENSTGDSLGAFGYDMVVFHPRVPDVAGRPGWLTMSGYRKPYALKLEPISAKTLVRAFVKTEPAGSVAMDQILIAANQTDASLMLPVGEYSVVRQNEAGESTQLGNVVIR
jgi:hypothetical protein